MRLRLLIVAAALSLGASSAAADDAWVGCTGDNADRGILSCSQLIQDRTLDKPSKSVAYYNRGRFQYLQGKVDAALADEDLAIELNPNFQIAYLMRAICRHDKGNYDGAIGDYDTSIRLQPDSADAFYNRARSYRMKNQIERAIQDLDQAVKIDPQYTIAHAVRGIYLQEMQRIDEARASYRRALASPVNKPKGEWAHEQSKLRLVALDGTGAAQSALKPENSTIPLAPVGKRVALVVGIKTYKHLKSLNNPVRDAQAVAAMLRSYGFEVVDKQDADFLTFYDALAQFEEDAKGSDIAIVYYAGHGMEIGGKNILAASDMPDVCDSSQARRAIELDRVFKAVSPARRKVVMLDACRDDPFPRCPKTRSGGPDGDGRSFRSLGRLEASGLIIINATAPGDLAEDGVAGLGSPFAKALLARMNQNARRDLRDVLNDVAEDVQRETGKQTPEVTTRGSVSKLCLSLEGCLP